MAVAQYYGTGRRKTSVARVRLVPGQGKITVNKKELTEYFGRKTLELIIKRPSYWQVLRNNTMSLQT